MLRSCLVIGAGLSGLLAARELTKAGVEVTVLEKARGAGGRMATCLIEEHQANFDHGAQFFTVREPRFAGLVEEWLAAGVAEEWSHGFATADGSYYNDGHSRYRGVPDMTAIAERLAVGLEVRLGMQAERVRVSPAGWTVETTSGERLTASGVVLTAPVPLSLALLDSGQVALPPLSRAALEMITYEPCLAVMLLLSGPGRVPEPGGLWPLGEPVAWVADNYRKGVSGVWGAITVHAGPEFSQTYWTADDEVIASHLVDATREWLGDDEVLTFRVHRWRYSRPARTHPEPILGVNGPEPLVFAGDAFAGPRIEGAALSGLAAADWLLR